jgi:Tfp pilus assembly protein PilE
MAVAPPPRSLWLIVVVVVVVVLAGVADSQDSYRLYMTKVYIKNACNKVKRKKADIFFLDICMSD